MFFGGDPDISLLEFIFTHPFTTIGFILGGVYHFDHLAPNSYVHRHELSGATLIGASCGFAVDTFLKWLLFSARAKHGNQTARGADSPHRAAPDFNRLYSHRESDSDLFLRCTFSLFAKLSKADGKISKDEISFLDNFMRDILLLDDSSRSRAKRIFRAAKNGTVTIRSLSNEVYGRFFDRAEVLRNLVVTLYQLACSDGVLSAEEDQLIMQVASILRFTEAESGEIRRQVASSTGASEGIDAEKASFYRKLECSPKASIMEIKSQFRRLAKRYHPDSASKLGMTPEAATRKFREIKEAYDFIRIVRNF